MATIATSPTLSTSRTRQHPRYYLNGGDLHLLIRGQIFRVHSYFFDRDSTRFLPAPHDNMGTSDEMSIIVDADPVKFEKLLWVFYNPTYSLYDASIDDWTDILELAHEWSFTQVKRLAIRELQKKEIQTATRIALYLKYKVDCDFLVPLYAELCSRTESLSLEEAEEIGLPVAIVIFRLREELRTHPPPPQASPLPDGITLVQVRQRVVTAFGFPPHVANQQPAPGPGTQPVLSSNGRTTFSGPSRVRRTAD
ncbi:hypothetical protein APHAL10511_000637 [Amanita phalloides]|nr:hypothetical protein APHAL10511_000637 [Amanita phalloides]